MYLLALQPILRLFGAVARVQGEGGTLHEAEAAALPAAQSLGRYLLLSR